VTDHYYLHEKVVIRYKVDVPPPASSAVLEVRRRDPKGEVVHVDRGLARQGEGELALDLAALKLGFEDSPLFAEITFTSEQGGKTVVKKSVQVFALAEPVVSSIFAPPEGYPGEAVKLEVLDWDARAYDEPGAPTQFEERESSRITAEARATVRWRIDGKEIPERGETVQATLAAEHLGRMIVVEGYVGEKPPAIGAFRVVVPKMSSRLQRSRLQHLPVEPARAEIAVPTLRLAGPPKVRVGGSISLDAVVDPPIGGTFAWTFEPEGRLESTELGGTASVTGLTPSETSADVVARCTFTSEALRTYRSELSLTVER
jgi:hypothetical protein